MRNTSGSNSSNKTKAPKSGKTGSAESDATYNKSKVKSGPQNVEGRTRKSAIRAGSPSHVEKDDAPKRVARGNWDDELDSVELKEEELDEGRVSVENFGRPDGKAMQWSDENTDDDSDDDVIVPNHRVTPGRSNSRH